MNNNAKLRQYLTNNNAGIQLGLSGREIADAPLDQLKTWVSALGMNPYAILEAKGSPVPVRSAAEEKLKALQDLLGSSASVDMDEVRDIVQQVIANDVLPSIEKMQSKVDSLAPLADTLDKIADAMKGGSTSRLPLAVAVASGNNPILELIQPFYTSGSANPTKVCISAPPSYGKSYSIALLGQSYDHCITHGCSDDMDEWHEFIGGASPKEDGNGFIVTDGKLANAVRLASNGESVLFFMDEVFRLSPKVMEKLLDFLAPQPDADGIKRYKLTTKHNASGVLETLVCAMDNLHIICATNLCEVIPPDAFRSRFLFKHVQFDSAMIANIATSVADKYGIIDAADLGGRFAMALERSREMKASGQLLTALDIRNLETACCHSSDNTAASVLMWMCANGLDGLKAWDSDTGDITLDSINGVAELANLLV